MDALPQKLARLQSALAAYGGAAVAFSGGVDSAFLLAAAHEVLGDKALAVTAVSCTIPRHELEEARQFCRDRHIRHVLLQIEASRLPWLSDNPPNRCYLCKLAVFKEIIRTAGEYGLQVVAEGSNTDDDGDYRPGMQAIRELGVRSPLRGAGLSKAEIRLLSRELELPTWNRPSLACLASRFPYGESISPEKLRAVEQAEQYLRGLGFNQLRVRVHGRLARIEITPEEFSRLLVHRLEIYDKLQEYGFSYVSMDLLGYRTGSMNETLPADNVRLDEAAP